MTLTPDQWRVSVHAMLRSAGPLSFGDLCRGLGVNPSPKAHADNDFRRVDAALQWLKRERRVRYVARKWEARP